MFYEQDFFTVLELPRGKHENRATDFIQFYRNSRILNKINAHTI